MYSEKTEIVDVVAITENNSTTYSLSKKAGDLYEAARNGDVIRRHNISDSPAVVNFAYVGLSGVKKDSNGYTFAFSNGDVFIASTADAYPSATAVNDLQTAKPMTFYSTTTNNAQLKKGSSSGSNTGKDEWDAIIEAMDNGLPVMVKIGDFSYPVIALYSAVSLETAYDRENKVVITGFGNSGTTTQTRLVWKKPKNNTEDA